MVSHYQTGLRVVTGKSVEEQNNKSLTAGRARHFTLLSREKDAQLAKI